MATTTPRRITPPHYLTPRELDVLSRATRAELLPWTVLRPSDALPLDTLQVGGYVTVTLQGIRPTADGRAVMERAR